MSTARARVTTALALAVTIALLAMAALVVLLEDASNAGGRGMVHAADHAGMTMDPSEAMYGDHVRAPGGPHATDALLDLPPARPYQPGRIRAFTLLAEEHDVEIAEGLMFPAWTLSEPGQEPTVPGPVLRVTEGDLVRITLVNNSTEPHSLHTHGIHPADQDGVLDMVQPGEQFTYEFTAGPAGVQPYHCHAMPLKKHIGKGLYGTMIVDPRHTPPPADREMAMVMNAYDTNHDGENEVYTVNGRAFYYAKYPIRVKRGELNRIYLANMTENDPLNSFHVHGNFFEYHPIGFMNPGTYTDVVTQIQGDRGIVDIRFPDTGRFMFHAHQTEFGDLGWMGFFEVVA